jgi:microcystin-dependent protein
MAEPYIGEIRMFGGTYAPQGWSFCNGSLISISDNPTLYNLIGTTYGGDGINTFGLPNLLGRMPIHAGTGQGTQTYVLGQSGGLEQVGLLTNQIPSHNHTLSGSTDTANASVPTDNVLAATASGTTPYIQAPARAAMDGISMAQAGGSTPHDNMMPFLCVNFIIALYGVYPSQG